MKAKSFLIAMAVLAVSAGCTTSNIDQRAAADPFQKTIAVPNTTGKLTADVKALLTNDNWQFQGANGQPIANPRYSMTLTYDQAEVCMPRFDPMYDYELYITDNKMGGRAFAMHGRDCQHTIIEHLDAFLRNQKI